MAGTLCIVNYFDQSITITCTDSLYCDAPVAKDVIGVIAPGQYVEMEYVYAGGTLIDFATFELLVTGPVNVSLEFRTQSDLRIWLTAEPSIGAYCITDDSTGFVWLLLGKLPTKAG